MAGGKETPRQKMIGMMYLVLTALLALNVSSAVLEKFAVLNNTLMDLRHESTDANAKTVSAILSATSTAKSVQEAKKKAEEVRKATDAVIKGLDDFKAELSRDHSGKEMSGEELILNTNISEEKVLSSTKPQFGKDFEKLLVDYGNQLNQITGLSLPKMNRRAIDYEEFKDNQRLADLDFLHFTFEGTPTMAAITTITQMQTEILENESIALGHLAEEADADIVKVDNLVPMVKPKSDIVASGDKYVADMFIAASSSGLTPEMWRNGQKLEVVTDPVTGIKMGKVEFIASASSYNAQNQSEQTFKAEIKIKDSVYVETVKYTVIKPVIKITTGNRPQLYLNCGNFVNIEVPSLGTNYNPTFRGSGATIVAGAKPSQPTIIPTEMKVSVTVMNGGANLGTETFDVKRIPRPHVTKKDQTGRDIDPKNGVKIGGLAQVRISVDPDESFKENVPKDAVYRIRNMEVALRRGQNYVATKTVNSEIVDLSDWKNTMRPGDMLVCNIKQVIRKTFLNQDDRVDFSDYVFIPLN